MRKLNVIIPMAGAGSRFKNHGILTPKPLLEVDGIPLFERAINSIISHFSFDEINLFCIVQKQHCLDFSIDDLIRQKFPFAKVIVLDKLTNGAVETCLFATDFISNLDDAMIVVDCDIEWNSYNYISSIKEVLRSDCNTIGGMLLSFKSDNPRYSYALSDKDGKVSSVAEKKVISNNALIGAYFFNSVSTFIDSSSDLLEHNSLSSVKEYYTSLLYNYIISSGKLVLIHDVDSFNSFGTPDELSEYEHSHFKN